MRPLELLFNIVEKYVPMSEQDQVELRRDANYDYLDIKEKVWDDKERKVKQKPTTWKEKLVVYSEKWWVRLAVALSFIWMVPRIKEYMNPTESETEDEVEYMEWE